MTLTKVLTEGRDDVRLRGEPTSRRIGEELAGVRGARPHQGEPHHATGQNISFDAVLRFKLDSKSCVLHPRIQALCAKWNAPQKSLDAWMSSRVNAERPQLEEMARAENPWYDSGWRVY